MRAIKSTGALAAGSIWLLLVVAGSARLWQYKQTAAAEPASPERWPEASRLPQSSSRPTLLLFAHPHCPCTRASIEELAQLLAHAQGRFSTHVVFFRPQGSKLSWAHGRLWDAAAAIPGVSIHEDEDGREAQIFHGATSGHFILYGVDGSRLFDGGITSSRGHAGDSRGLGTLLALAYGQAPEQRRTAVFGCPILAPPIDALAGGTSCNR